MADRHSDPASVGTAMIDDSEFGNIHKGAAMAQLFIVTIGPVQDFIATARRTRDLWFGSWLLSELSREAALAVVRFDPRCSLIFPSGDAASLAKREHDVVNRIVAEVPDAEDGAQLGITVEEAIRERLRSIWRQTVERRSSLRDDTEWDRVRANEQIDDMLEVAWAVVPFVPNNYRASRWVLESVIAARKATRNFAPITWGAAVPKSSLDGSRESVIPETRYGYRGDDAARLKRKATYLYRTFGAGAAERLSGVDLLKRLGNRDPMAAADAGDLADFPSTAHIAALPFLRQLGDPARYHYALTNYVQHLQGLGAIPERLACRYQKTEAGHTAPLLAGYDASILFEERLVDLVIAADLQEARGSLEEFIRATVESGRPRRPQPYYALLLADGDNMGSTIDAQQQPDDHRKLSAALDGFASSVRGIVESKFDGALVYSGGDDVLALLPLDRVLECAKALHAAFGAAVGAYHGHDADGVARNPSLSVGIAVCHHIEPLSDSLALVRAAEKIAKGYPGKDALAITLSKRSGVDCTIVGSWKTDFFKRLNQLIGWHRADAISGGTAYELRGMQRRIPVPPPPAAPHAAGSDGERAADTWYDIQRLEATRIAGRKRGEHGRATKAYGDFVALVETLPTTERDRAERQWDVGALADELIVAAAFAGV
jgi:CRISPR-associated protein Cmr2